MSGITDAVTALEAAHPGWQVWAVTRVTGGTVWCARPWAGGDDATHTLNAASPGDLAAKIEAAQAQGFLP